MNSGIYVRVGNEDKLVEEINQLEREMWLSENKSMEFIQNLIHRLCDVLYEMESHMYQPDEEEK